MPKSRPLVVFVFPYEGTATSTKYAGFARRLKKAGGLKEYDTLTVALENLAFSVYEDGAADVVDTVSGVSLSQADMVYMKALGEESAALAIFLHHRGIPFMDTASMYVRGSKLATTFRMWGAGLRVPFTFYLRNGEKFKNYLDTSFPESLGEYFILKDANGSKGNLNFRVNREQAKEVVNAHPDIQFVCQRFIENEGDYRIGVYASAARFVIRRVGKEGTHLNNTSAGGTASYLDVGELPKPWLRLAEKAAHAAHLEVAGVDIIVDSQTKRPYILEVNQGSQIVTGAFTDQNMRAFNEALDETVRVRHAKGRMQPATIIGRRSVAKLPDLGIRRAVAKIDTGAYTSSLHAEDIHIENNEHGDEELVFTVGSSNLVSHEDKRQTIRVKNFFVQSVRSSNGQIEKRYSIKTTIILEKRRFKITLTLNDRSAMGYPLLIGRRALRSRFIVNVELNEAHEVSWKY